MTSANHKSKKLIHSQGKTEITSFEGLIPDNDSLDKLEQYAPGATKRWMDLAESEIKARQFNEKHFLTTVRYSNWFVLFFVSGLCVAAFSRNLKLTTTLDRAITQTPCYVVVFFFIFCAVRVFFPSNYQ